MPTDATTACEWCGRAIAQNVAERRWYAVKGEERGYDRLVCDASDDRCHSPDQPTTTAAACAGCGPYSDHCAGCPASRPDATHTALAALVEALTPLMAGDYCSPFTSAWELDPYGGHNGDLDGEVIYEQVKAAWEQAQAIASGS